MDWYMNRRPRAWVLVCLIGLLGSLLLAGVVLAARQRALLQASTVSYHPLDGEARWEGDWEFSELGADPSQAGTERVTIPFVGTDFALRVRRGNYRGAFFVSVDGEPANLLPREERGAYLVLTSPDYTRQVVTVPVAAGLGGGPHEAVVVAERGWDQWPLVGWRVSRTPDTTWYRWALAGLGALGLACVAGLLGVRSSLQLRQDSGRRYTQVDADGHKESALIRVYLRPIVGVSQSLARRFPLDDGPAIAAVLTAAGVFYFSPWLTPTNGPMLAALTLLSGLALGALILLRLDLGLALVVAAAPFYRYPRPLFGRAFSMAEIATLLCLVSWGLRQLATWHNQPTDQPTSQPPTQTPIPSLSNLDRAVLFFIVAAVVSTFFAEYRHVALRELRVVVLEPALFYLMLRTGRLDGKALWRIVDLFVLGAVVVALIGLVQYGLGVNVITAEQGFRRLRSVYGSPNNAGLYLGRVLPVLVAVALFATARGRRVAYGLATLPVGLAVLLSFSKGALILGVPLSLLALGVLAGRPWSWASLGTVAAAAIAAVPLLRTPRFASLLDTHGGTTFFRLQLWQSSWMMFRDHPWLGVGPDNFLYQYRGRYILPVAWQEPDLSHPHNTFLDYGCRLGLCGLVAGFWLQIAFWRLALPLRRLVEGPTGLAGIPDRRALALGLMGSMVNFLAHGLVDASYFVIDLAFVFFLTLGVVQWLARSETDELET
jgi:O-antigen ligase